jgi:MFS family permease
MRTAIPESPRWLMIHGRADEAHAILDAIEDGHRRQGHSLPDEDLPKFRCRARRSTPLGEVWQALFLTHRRRTLVGLSLMAAQAFLYNAIFFTYALVLTAFYGIRSDQVGWYLLPFAAGNFLGPLLLGRLFDTIGRRVMIAATYAISGVLLALTGYFFAAGLLSATAQTIAWTIIFFFASAAASSAYLTVSETFPLEVRALAIAFFYAVGTGIGGVAAPWLFGALIDTGSRVSLFGGYLLGATLMLAAAIIAHRFGVDAERKPLEAVAIPLSAVD